MTISKISENISTELVNDLFKVANFVERGRDTSNDHNAIPVYGLLTELLADETMTLCCQGRCFLFLE